jgi:RHS repeat-associated protein
VKFFFSRMHITLIENYDPFGNIIASMGSNNSILGFTGQQTDPTGLQFLYARYYDPSMGMFVARFFGAVMGSYYAEVCTEIQNEINGK